MDTSTDTAAKVAKITGIISMDMALRQPPRPLKELMLANTSRHAIARALPRLTARQRLGVEVASAVALGIFRKGPDALPDSARRAA